MPSSGDMLRSADIIRFRSYRASHPNRSSSPASSSSDAHRLCGVGLLRNLNNVVHAGWFASSGPAIGPMASNCRSVPNACIHPTGHLSELTRRRGCCPLRSLKSWCYLYFGSPSLF